MTNKKVKKRSLSHQGNIQLPGDMDLKIHYKGRKMLAKSLYPNDVTHIWITDAPLIPPDQRKVDYMLRITKNGTVIVEDLKQQTTEDYK